MSDMQTPPSGEDKARKRKERQRAIPLVPEVRFYHGGIAEFREDSATGLVTITGTPIVYNTPYTVNDMFGEFTERMNDSVGEDAIARQFDVRLLENHKGLPFARTKPAQGKPPTLFLEHVAGQGIRMRAELDGNVPRVQDLLSAISRGDAGEMSVGFMVGEDQWSEDYMEREIFRFSEWLDVSVVTFAASPTTDVELGRSRRMLIDVRSGKVMSGDNMTKIADAAKAVHALYAAGGGDPASLLESDAPDTQNEDGSDGGTTGAGATSPDAVNPDGSGVFRTDVDPGEKIRLLTEILDAAVERNQPTPEDWSIASALKNLKGELAIVKAKQLADPDNESDPDDQSVMAAIEEAEAAIDKAVVAQSKDSHDDKPEPRGSTQLLERVDRELSIAAEVRAAAQQTLASK